MPEAAETISFEKFPFITGLFPSREFTSELPEYLPLAVGLRKDLGLVTQQNNCEIDRQLGLAYKMGSVISTSLGEGNLNASLCTEILEFLQEACNGVAGKHFLEPGCGKGFLLNQLSDRGASRLVGCEPGPFSNGAAPASRVELINTFFDPSHFSDQFDCVYHTMVLEHIKEPETFLRQNIQVLKDTGVVLLLVPGCEEDLEHGNFMVLAHEHFSYFTRRSLRFLMEKAGLVDVQVRQCSYSQGILCAWGEKASDTNSASEALPSEAHITEEFQLLNTFIDKSQRCLAYLQERANALARDGKSLGLYGSPRALAGLLDFDPPPRNFDGDSAKHGSYFAGSPNPIEPPQALLQDPVDELWVLPIHHDRAIRKYLSEAVLPYQSIAVFSLKEYLTNQLPAKRSADSR